MTQAVLVELYRLRHRETANVYRANEEMYWLRKGRVDMIDKVLGAIDQLESEILSRGRREEQPTEDDE